MTLNGYQRAAMTTAIYPPDRGLDYTVMNLAAEAGEVAGQYAKAIRDDAGLVTDERRQTLIKELGDVLWQVAAVAHELQIDLSDVATMNLDRLASRAARGMLGGSGDDR